MAKAKSGGWLDNIKTIVYAGLIAVAIRTVAFEPFNIPSGSMIPTLLVGDYLFVSKFAYGYSIYSLPFSPPLFHGRIFGSLPKRGDVVVFKNEHADYADYIKRIVGLPGDHIQVQGGMLYVNGQPAVRRPLGNVVATDESGGSIEEREYDRDAARQRHAPDREDGRHGGGEQHRGIRGAGRQSVRHGRQPGQQPGQPVRRRPSAGRSSAASKVSRSCRSRTWSDRRSSSSSPSTRVRHGGKYGNGRWKSAGAGC